MEFDPDRLRALPKPGELHPISISHSVAVTERQLHASIRSHECSKFVFCFHFRLPQRARHFLCTVCFRIDCIGTTCGWMQRANHKSQSIASNRYANRRNGETTKNIFMCFVHWLLSIESRSNITWMNVCSVVAFSKTGNDANCQIHNFLWHSYSICHLVQLAATLS